MPAAHEFIASSVEVHRIPELGRGNTCLYGNARNVGRVRQSRKISILFSGPPHSLEHLGVSCFDCAARNCSPVRCFVGGSLGDWAAHKSSLSMLQDIPGRVLHAARQALQQFTFHLQLFGHLRGQLYTQQQRGRRLIRHSPGSWGYESSLRRLYLRVLTQDC